MRRKGGLNMTASQYIYFMANALIEINKLSNPTINELSESNYSNLVSGVTDIVSKRFVHQSLDIQTKQERLALINLISIKLVNKLIDSIGEIQPNTIDQKQVNKHLEEFINGFGLDENKKTYDKL